MNNYFSTCGFIRYFELQQSFSFKVNLTFDDPDLFPCVEKIEKNEFEFILPKFWKRGDPNISLLPFEYDGYYWELLISNDNDEDIFSISITLLNESKKELTTETYQCKILIEINEGDLYDNEIVFNQPKGGSEIIQEEDLVGSFPRRGDLEFSIKFFEN
ncbi:hypothetical protein M0812_25194 [Anaeramoeba flamelloides]|uniref:MATH domain-containing protein n=1 Tax=Anaeramoeba flamelloides TaxID=1746091 RepID=A0AAV7YF13_9EUKA|nr:hypothetical protein M0812_25194 [Anaeramoeba flamelloides]